jgi:hypothetical protein
MTTIDTGAATRVAPRIYPIRRHRGEEPWALWTQPPGKKAKVFSFNQYGRDAQLAAEGYWATGTVVTIPPFHVPTERERAVRLALSQDRARRGIHKDELPEDLVPKARRSAKSETREGYVYFILDGEWVKIGESETYPEGRLGSFQTGNPRNLELAHAVYSDDRLTLEAELHAKYAAVRVRGEWFLADAVLRGEGIA